MTPRERLKKVISVAVGGIGYILSPLSWWNDLYVNIPISYLVADFVSRRSSELFIPILAGAYWMTNILGLILMHAGGAGVVSGADTKWDRRSVLRGLALSLLYTLVVVFLSKAGLIRPIREYLN